MSRCRRRHCVAVGALLLAFTGAVRADGSFAVRDQNPLLRGIYLPLAGVAPPALAGESREAAGWKLAVGLQWSNTVNVESTVSEALIVDGEAAELDITAQRSLGAWQLRAVLPVIWRGGGALDGFIDSWHDVFGLPEGQRPAFERNLFAIRYARAGEPPFAAREGAALGDLALEAGRSLVSGPRGVLDAWVGVELPTGSRSRLTGNGGFDAAAWLSGKLELGDRVEIFGRGGAAAPNGDTFIDERDVFGFATLTLDWRVFSRLSLVAQVDAHTRMAGESSLALLRSATILTLGGRVPLASGAIFEAGVSEDVAVGRSPDVVFHVAWRWPLARLR